ncbi:DoxX family protein [Algoriphagus aestuarii]|nr:DoxX family protein [Algoriphagus aestuarii]
MSKRNKIIYWIATCWLSLGMLSTGIVQLIRMEEEVQKMEVLGYSPYFLTIIGCWKILGVFVLLIPGYTLVKEWAYAGFFFLISGAIFSHLAVGDPTVEYFGPGMLLVLVLVSWYFRPDGRKINV